MNTKRIFKNVIFLSVLSILVYINDKHAFYSFGYIAVFSFATYAMVCGDIPEALVEKGEYQFQLKQIYRKEKSEELDSSETKQKEKIIEKITCLESKIEGQLVIGLIVWILNLAVGVLME